MKSNHYRCCLPSPNPQVCSEALVNSRAGGNVFAGNDYLANGGNLLREAISSDVEIQRKLTDALAIFDDCEKKTKDFLDNIL